MKSTEVALCSPALARLARVCAQQGWAYGDVMVWAIAKRIRWGHICEEL